MRQYKFADINEIGPAWRFIDGKPHPNYGYEQRLLANTDPRLVENFHKVCDWIAKNCPTLIGEFPCEHRVYYWLTLKVEDGKAYLEKGSHGHSLFECAISRTESATAHPGSCSSEMTAFDGVFFFFNERLEEFLKQWPSIKQRVFAEYKAQSNVYSSNFEA